MRHFPKLALSLTTAVFAATTAVADDCEAQVRALWDQGSPLDAYQRPPHRTATTMYDADGNVTREFTAIIETPLRTIAGIEGTHMTMAVDNDVWSGPTEQGPWAAQQGFTGDRRAGHEAGRQQMQANAENFVCHGMVERDGVSYQAYGYTTRTDPDESMGGAWYGSTDTVYLDPETRQVMIWEMGEFRSSWATEPNGDHHLVIHTYDSSIKVMAPE